MLHRTNCDPYRFFGKTSTKIIEEELREITVVLMRSHQTNNNILVGV